MIVKSGKCEFCGCRIVVMTTETNSLLPAEIQEGVTIEKEEIFNPKKHKSHLKNCEKQRLNWERKKNTIWKQVEGLSMLD